MPELGVNIDHIATIRQARRTYEPDPVWAAALAEMGGADCITLHLREDRRHINDRDLRILRETVTVKLNLEMACNEEILKIALSVKPDQATLVPERREEITTEGGLDIITHKMRAADAIRRLQDAGISVSLFLDPESAANRRSGPIESRCRGTPHRPIRRIPARRQKTKGTGKTGNHRRHDSAIGHGAARRPRPELPQCPPRCRD